MRIGIEAGGGRNIRVRPARSCVFLSITCIGGGVDGGDRDSGGLFRAVVRGEHVCNLFAACMQAVVVLFGRERVSAGACVWTCDIVWNEKR